MSEPPAAPKGPPRSAWAGVPFWALLTPALIALVVIAIAVWRLS